MESKDYGFLTEDMEKVEYLQEVIQRYIELGVGDFADNPNPDETEHRILVDYFHNFYALMEYQHILYTRLTLMDDPELQGILDAIASVSEALGKTKEESMSQFFLNMQEDCRTALTELTGEDLDSYEGIDVDFRW